MSRGPRQLAAREKVGRWPGSLWHGRGGGGGGGEVFQERGGTSPALADWVAARADRRESGAALGRESLESDLISRGLTSSSGCIRSPPVARPHKLLPLELALSLKPLEARQSGRQKGDVNAVEGRDKPES